MIKKSVMEILDFIIIMLHLLLNLIMLMFKKAYYEILFKTEFKM